MFSTFLDHPYDSFKCLFPAIFSLQIFHFRVFRLEGKGMIDSTNPGPQEDCSHEKII